MENFGIATEDVQTGLTQDDFDMYYEKWEKYDPKATGYIQMEQTYDLLDELEKPLKLEKPNKLKLVALNVPIYEGELINCVDLLDALTRYVLSTDEETPERIAPKNLGDKVNKMNYKVIGTTMARKREAVAIGVILKAIRKFKQLRAAGLLNTASSPEIDAQYEQTDYIDDIVMEPGEFTGAGNRDGSMPHMDTASSVTPVSIHA